MQPLLLSTFGEALLSLVSFFSAAHHVWGIPQGSFDSTYSTICIVAIFFVSSATFRNFVGTLDGETLDARTALSPGQGRATVLIYAARGLRSDVEDGVGQLGTILRAQGKADAARALQEEDSDVSTCQHAYSSIFFVPGTV